MPPETFVSLSETASHLGVPAAWLRNEAQTGQIPHLKVGRRLLFNIKVVERVLLERSQVEASHD